MDTATDRTILCTTNLIRLGFLFTVSSISVSIQWFVKGSIGWGFNYLENIVYIIYPMVSQVVCVCKREMEAKGLLQQLWWGWLTSHCVRNAAHVNKCSVVLSRDVDKCCLEVISFFSFILHKEFLTLKTLFMNGKI